MISICDLEKEKLGCLLEIIPMVELQKPFSDLKKYKNKIKGFRPGKIPDTILKNYYSIHIKKDKMLCDYVSNIIKNIIENIEKEKVETLKVFNNEYFASAKAITSYFPKERIDLYFYLRERNDKIFIDKIKLYVEFLPLITKINDLEEEVKNFEKLFDEKIIPQKNYDNEITEIYQKLKSFDVSINNKFKEYYSINEIDIKLYNINQKIENLNKELEFNRNNNLYLQQEISQYKKNYNEFENCCIERNDKNEHSIEDGEDFLIDNLTFNLKKYFNGEYSELFSTYLLNLIYNKKYILVNREIAIFLTKCISATLDGGRYLKIIVENNNFNLRETLKKIGELKEKVILIDGYMSQFDEIQIFYNLEEYKELNKIFILSINHDKYIRFMTDELLNYFDYINIDFHQNNIYSFDYYQINLSMSNIKTAETNEIKKCLNEIELVANIKAIDKYDIENLKFAFLIFEFIPFKSFNSGIDYEDVIDTIKNKLLQSKIYEYFRK